MSVSAEPAQYTPNDIRIMIRTEMVRNDVRYKELQDRLRRDHDVAMSLNNLRNIVNRGKLSALLFFQIMSSLRAVEEETV